MIITGKQQYKKRLRICGVSGEKFEKNQTQKFKKNGAQLKCLVFNDKYKLRRHSLLYVYPLESAKKFTCHFQWRQY